jgi:hypothetical protein
MDKAAPYQGGLMPSMPARNPIVVRQVKYLNIVEQDHWAVKRVSKPMLNFKSFERQKCPDRHRIMHMIWRQLQLSALSRILPISFMRWKNKSVPFEELACVPTPSTFISRQRDSIQLPERSSSGIQWSNGRASGFADFL